jgi:hypothetical protein
MSVAAIVLPVLLAVVSAATRSQSKESMPAIWGPGDRLQIPKEELDAGTPIEPYAPFTAGAAGMPAADPDS